MVLLGQPEVGKTSLFRCLKGEPFIEARDTESHRRATRTQDSQPLYFDVPVQAEEGGTVQVKVSLKRCDNE